MNLAIFGATGQVGQVVRSIALERNLPIEGLRFFASPRSKGKVIEFGDAKVVVEDSWDANFDGIDVAIFSNGATASADLAPKVAGSGAIVIDNSSAWRMDPDVPLVVPEVNPEALNFIRKNIVANPNCTTMICMSTLDMLAKKFGIKRVVGSTYQAVSGAGIAGVNELADQLAKGGELLKNLTFDGAGLSLGNSEQFGEPIAANVIPKAGEFIDEETVEEHKFRNESRKILGIRDLAISMTCVRVPVFTGHSLALNIELESQFVIDQVRKLISEIPGVKLVDVPTPQKVAGTDLNLVGRVRRDDSVRYGLSLFISGDNLRKGAALNAIQIAETLIERGQVR